MEAFLCPEIIFFSCIEAFLVMPPPFSLAATGEQLLESGAERRRAGGDDGARHRKDTEERTAPLEAALHGFVYSDDFYGW